MLKISCAPTHAAVRSPNSALVIEEVTNDAGGCQMTDRDVPDGRLLQRREFLAAASTVVAGGVTAVGAAGVASADDEMTYVAARVAGHPSPDVLEVVPYGTDVTVRVRLAAGGSAVHRDQRGAKLSDFGVGDSVTFDVAGLSNGHDDIDERDAGRLFVAVHVSDTRPGTYESRGRSAG